MPSLQGQRPSNDTNADIPPRMLERRRRKQRFETQTPVVGAGCAVTFFVGFLVFFTQLSWSLIFTVAVFGAGVIILRYQMAWQRIRQREEDIARWHNGE